ncbi:hypothetical protein T03_800, partial [Trichinella britovi]
LTNQPTLRLTSGHSTQICPRFSGGLICRLINVDNHINGRSQLDAAGQSELSVVQSPTSGYSDGSIFTVDRSVNSSTPPTDRPTD